MWLHVSTEEDFGRLMGRMGTPVPGVERLAVLRANGIGDYLFALPALRALRAAYPRAEITLLGSPWHAAVLPRIGDPVDRVIIAPPAPGIREPTENEHGCASPIELADFFGQMVRERFDLAVQLHGGGRNSNPFVKRLEARTTAGLHTEDAEALDRNLPFYYYQHEVIRYLEVAALAGARPTELAPRWEVLDHEREVLGGMLPADGLPVAALFPGAGDPRRRWPIERFAAVGRALAEAGARVVVVGSAADRTLGMQLASQVGEHTLDLTGRMPIGVSAALLEHARLLVSNDSGPLHLARAVGTATVGIYWCGNVINAGPLVNARHRVALSWMLACPECGADCVHGSCDHDVSFVTDVAVAEVVSAALDLWQREAGSRLR